MTPRRLLAGLVLVMAVGAGQWARAEGPAGQDVVLKGKVLPLATVLERAKIPTRIDAQLLSKQVVLVDGDSQVIPLIPDEASRALFLDERLRDRPAEIKGKRFPGLPYVQVVTFKIEEAGRLRTPEYYCNICTIHVRYPQTCPCCHGEMELRMRPEKD